MSSKHNGEEKKVRFLYARFKRSSEVPYIIQFLIRKHIAKNESDARRMVVATIIAILLLSSYLILKCESSPVFVDKIYNR